jgi:hypothetical protein
MKETRRETSLYTRMKNNKIEKKTEPKERKQSSSSERAGISKRIPTEVTSSRQKGGRTTATEAGTRHDTQPT